jgi:uroporphyrinogen decarboxylase
MRQAGRVLPEYRAFREKHSFLDCAREPELCAEVTVQPVDRLGVDAAILFSDILMPVAAMGIGLDFAPGPILDRPYDPAAGLGSLRVPDPETDYAYLAACIRAVLERLDGRVPLIGFAGAPFTLATYLVEGGGSKQYPRTRAWMNTDPDGFREFLFFLADRIADWLAVQVKAGVRAYQLFDSWAGVLSPRDMERFALPAARRVFERVDVPADFPTIWFAPGAGGSLRAQAEVGSKVLGVDWRVDLAEVRAAFPDRTLQGNLDPGVLLGSKEAVEDGVRRVLEAAGTAAGHVFNLGHGFLPETPVENAEHLVRTVHRLSREVRS